MSTISIVRTLALPPLSLFLLYATGLIVCKYKPRLGRMLCHTSLAGLFILSTHAAAWLLVRPLENLEMPLVTTNGAQAIVVLAAGKLRNSPEYGGRDIPDYVALARLRYTARLHHETGLPVLVSGGAGITEDNIEPLASGMVNALQNEFSTPVTWTEPTSDNTAENAQYSARILKKSGISRILLVTDAMHMHRAKVIFMHQGLEVIAAPTMFFAQDKLGLSDLLPSVEGMRLSNYAIYEWLGLVWYRLKYGA